MSRIGKKTIHIPSGVLVKFLDEGIVEVSNNNKILREKIPGCVKVEIGDEEIKLDIKNHEDDKQNAYWGLSRSLIANMVEGVFRGFEKKLEVNGVGYRVLLSGDKLVLNLGFSHPVDFKLPKNIQAKVEGNNIIISGSSKQLVGQVAANIRKLRKPEPYKGKGIKYSDEEVRRKAGKVAKGGK